MNQITITFFQLLNDTPISEHSLTLALYSSDKLIHQITGFASRLTLYFNVELSLDSAQLLLLFTHKGFQKKAQLTPEVMPFGVPFQLQFKGNQNSKAVLKLMLDHRKNILYQSIQVSVLSGKISSLVATSQQLMVRAVAGKQFNCSSCKSLKDEEVSWNFSFSFQRHKQKNIYFQLWALSISDKRYFAYGICSLDKQQTLLQVRLQNQAGRFVGTLKVRIQRNQAVKNINLHVDHARLFNNYEVNLFQVLIKMIRTEQDVSMQSTRKQADYGGVVIFNQDFNFRIANEVLLQISLYNHQAIVGTFIHNITDLLAKKSHTVELTSFQAVAASLHFRIFSNTDKTQPAISDSMTTDYIEINKKYQPAAIRHLQKKSPDLLPLPTCLNASVVVKQETYVPQKKDILSKARKRMESFSKIYHNADQYQPSWQILQPTLNYVPTWAQQKASVLKRNRQPDKLPRSVQTKRGENVKLVRESPFKQSSEDHKNPQRLISNKNESMPLFRPSLKNNQNLFNKLTFQQTFQFSSHQDRSKLQMPKKAQRDLPVKLLNKERRDSQLRQIVQQRQKIERIKEKQRQQRKKSLLKEESSSNRAAIQALKKQHREPFQKRVPHTTRQQQQSQERRVTSKQEIISKGTRFAMLSKKMSQPVHLSRPDGAQSHYNQFYLLNKKDSIHQIASAAQEYNQAFESAEQLGDWEKVLPKQTQAQNVKNLKGSKQGTKEARINAKARLAQKKRSNDSSIIKAQIKSKTVQNEEQSDQSQSNAAQNKKIQKVQRLKKYKMVSDDEVKELKYKKESTSKRNAGQVQQLVQMKKKKKTTKSKQSQQSDLQKNKKKATKSKLLSQQSDLQKNKKKTTKSKQSQQSDLQKKQKKATKSKQSQQSDLQRKQNMRQYEQPKRKRQQKSTKRSSLQQIQSKGKKTDLTPGAGKRPYNQLLQDQSALSAQLKEESMGKRSGLKVSQLKPIKSQKSGKSEKVAGEQDEDEQQSQNQFINYHRRDIKQNNSQSLQVQCDMKTSFPSHSKSPYSNPTSRRPFVQPLLYGRGNSQTSPQRFDSFRKFMTAELAGPLLKGIKRLLKQNPRNKIERLGQILLGN